MLTRLADRLRSAREERFVGRERERALFSSTVRSAERPCQLLYVHGPGGIGKTSLLTEFCRVCRQEGVPACYLDARGVEPSPHGFLEGLRGALDLDAEENPLGRLQAAQGTQVLLLDTCENLLPLDGWLREEFLTQLPGESVVVLASREPPQPAWKSDPGWQSLMRTVPLRNLSPEESREYLERRSVPARDHRAIFDFTHGHPLALSLVADAHAQHAQEEFRPDEEPDLIRTLLDRFVQHLPGALHRTALEACSLVRITTEPLLAAMVEAPDPGALFDWLRGLSFIEAGRTGLFPHDLAREVLSADLRWRSPERYAELHRRARVYYGQKLQETSGQEQRNILAEYIYLHRDNPVVRPFFEWHFGATLKAGPARPDDAASLRAIACAHEGEESAQWLEFWFQRLPDRFMVVRDDKAQPAGCLCFLPLHEGDPRELRKDPASRSCLEYLQKRAPLREGEAATLFRFWMARDTYQQVSPVQSLLVVHIVQHYLTMPGLAFTFIPCADPDFWLPAYSYANLVRLPEADYAIGGRRYGVYGHDWRKTPPVQWLSLLAERELGLESEPPAAVRAESLLVLSREEFDAAVRAALRGYTKPDTLRDNPLLRTRLVAQKSESPSRKRRAEVLCKLMREAASSMKASPREVKLLRALHYTYFQPLDTQELAAERLNLPFSTYRRHLVRGQARLSELLWKMEVGE